MSHLFFSDSRTSPGHLLRRLFFLFVVCALSPMIESVSQAQPNQPLTGALYVEDKARGLRFEPPLMCLHFDLNNPQKMIVGNRLGRVYQSEDGGESWLEGSVLTPRSSFLGAMRSQYPSAQLSISLLNEGILPSPGQLFSFQNLIDLNQRLPQAGGLVRSYFNQDIEGSAEMLGFMGSSRPRRASYRLASLVRKKTGFTIGTEWRDPVRTKFNNQIAVRYIATPPHKPNEIIVATEGGVFHSRDEGDSWPLSFSGLNADERNVNVVMINPHRPNEIWLGTRGGLRISRDGGETYTVADNRFVVRSNIQWITFDQVNPQKVYVGLNWAMLLSEDGGQTFDIAFYDTYPALSNISRIFVDPHRPERVLLGTADGLMISYKGGRDFSRAGGLLFMGQPIVDILQGFQPGHYIVATEQDLWQSFDGGQNWQIAYFGGVDWYIRMVKRSPQRYGELWVLTSAEILRLSSQPPPPSDPRGYNELKARLLREPSMSEVVNIALRQAGVHRDKRLALEQSAKTSAFLPKIDVFLAQRSALIDFELINYFLKSEGEITNQNDGNFSYKVWGAFLYWDLRDLIYHRGEVPIHKLEGTHRRREEEVRSFVINLYQERFNLITSLQLYPSDLRTTLMRHLRLEELTAHLNHITDDLFKPVEALDLIQKR